MGVWGTVYTVAGAVLGSGAFVTFLNWLLGRKDADKRLNLEDTKTDTSVFAEQRRAYEDLLNRAEAAQAAAELARDEAVKQSTAYQQERGDLLKTVQSLTTKVEELQRADAAREGKFQTLIHVFQRYVLRVAVPLTADEWEDVDATIPTSMLKIKRG